MPLKKVILVLLMLTMASACVRYKKLRYLTDLTSDSTSVLVTDSSNFYRIRSGDVLYIRVVSSTDSKMELFNQTLSNNQVPVSGGVQPNLLSGYLVDEYGDIELPMVGLIRISGLKIKEAEQKVHEALSEYLQYVTVTVKLMSFRVSVLGEVHQPGVKQIDRVNVSVYEILAYSGDMTEVANRKKIRLIRREQNQNKVYTLDLSSSQMLSSAHYYLRPGDIVYVEPLRYKAVKVNSTTITLAFSLFSIGLSLFAIFGR